MNLRSGTVLVACLAISPSLLADFTYRETTTITGGAIVGMMKLAGAFSSTAKKAGQPVVSTIYLKGNQMAEVNDTSTQIIDLDRETITEINHQDHTYVVVTFEQMRQQIEDAKKKMEKSAAQAPKSTAPAGDPTMDMKFKVNVRNTGASKDVSGVPTNESILAMQMEATDKKSGQTGALAITNDMWMAPEIPGYAELRDFEIRYAAKMGRVLSSAFTPAMLAMQPAMGQGLADMVKEMSKLKGVPLMQVMRVGMTANGEPLPAASEAPLPPLSDGPSAGDIIKQGATEAATDEAAKHMNVMGVNLSGFSGLSGLGRKKKAEPAPAPATPAATTAASSVLIESSIEKSGFSSASLDASHFVPPAGYKQVQPKTQQ